MDKRTIDISGQQFGRLTAIAYVGKKKWRCVCTCGKETVVRGAMLRNGSVKSCGCFTGGAGVPRSHGATANGRQTREYNAWIHMRDRCNNPNNQNYSDYGGRGITVCDRWLHSFENFLADMGTAPKGFTVDRIDNSKGYSPDNCRWATQKQQCNNRRPKRTSLMYELDGVVQDLGAWVKDARCVVCYQTLRYRVRYRNTPLFEAMTTPLNKLTKPDGVI